MLISSAPTFELPARGIFPIQSVGTSVYSTFDQLLNINGFKMYVKKWMFNPFFRPTQKDLDHGFGISIRSCEIFTRLIRGLAPPFQIPTPGTDRSLVNPVISEHTYTRCSDPIVFDLHGPGYRVGQYPHGGRGGGGYGEKGRKTWTCEGQY
jgi:hypothetical protein